MAKRIMEIGTHYMLEDKLKIEFMKAENMDLEKLRQADGIIIGSPDYYDYPAGIIKTFFDEMHDYGDTMKKILNFNFITHGHGGGKAAKFLDDLSSAIKLNSVASCIPVEEDDIDKKVEKKIIKALQDMIKKLGVKANF